MTGINYFRLQWNELTSLAMLSFIFNSQFRVLIVRERKHFWSSLPGKGLLISSTSAIIGISIITFFGVFVPSLRPAIILTVLGISALGNLNRFPQILFV